MSKSNWGFDLDPTAGFELCDCGSGYVVEGTVCVDCEHKAQLAELRKFYAPDEAEVRATLDLEYASRRAEARVQREVVLPKTTIDTHLATTAADPRYFAGKVLRVWEATARTAATQRPGSLSVRILGIHPIRR